MTAEGILQAMQNLSPDNSENEDGNDISDNSLYADEFDSSSAEFEI